MKKMTITLILGLALPLFSSNKFEDKHLKCTLVKEAGETISERQAEAKGQYKLDLIITKTKLTIGYKIFDFKETVGYDMYRKENYDGYIKAYLSGDYLNIERVITSTYVAEKPYFISDGKKLYLPDDYIYNRQVEQNKESEKRDRKLEKEDTLKYKCIEPTFMEKLKYKSDNF